jgi:regulation of enolase protein 1 (concanavalin A-like superfamily)
MPISRSTATGTLRFSGARLLAAKLRTRFAPLHGPARLRIERKGNLFTTSVGPAGGPLTAFSSATVVMDGPVYVGIGFCSHNADGLASVTFSNVTIEKPAR